MGRGWVGERGVVRRVSRVSWGGSRASVQACKLPHAHTCALHAVAYNDARRPAINTAAVSHTCNGHADTMFVLTCGCLE